MDDNLKNGSPTSALKRFKDGYLANETDKKPTKESEATISEELLLRYKSKRSNWERKGIQCQRFRAGYQWDKAEIDELKRKRKAPLVVNIINPAVEQFKALLTSRRPRFNALPREGSDRKTAVAFSALMEYIWQRNQGNVLLKETLDDYSVLGLGWMCAYWDPYEDMGKGEVVYETLDPYDVFVDPSSKKRDFSDARHMLIVKYWSKEEVMENYPSISAKWLETAEKSAPQSYGSHTAENDEIELEKQYDGDLDYYEIIDRYSKRRKTMVHFALDEYEHTVEMEREDEFLNRKCYVVSTINLQEGTSEISYAVEDDDIVALTQTMKKLGTMWHIVPSMDQQTGQVVPQPVRGPAQGPDAIAQTNVKQITIRELVTSGAMDRTVYPGNYIYRVLSIGGKVYWKGYTGTTVYPLVPFPNRHKRNPFPMSDVHATMTLQRELNVTRQHIMTHTANVASIKIAVPKGATKVEDMEDKLSKAGISVIEYNAEGGGAPVYMYPPQLPSQLYESEQRFSTTIYEQFGVYPFMGGSDQGGHSTSSGILILDELSQRRIASKRSDIEFSLNVLGKVTVELCQRFYTQRKVIRLLQPSGRFNEIEINSPLYETYPDRLMNRINDITIGLYDLVIESGSTLPTNRMIRMEYFLKLYSQGLIDQYEVLKNVDEVDVEGVIERMGVLQQLQGQVEALSEEVKKLEGDLQTADREAVGARKRVEVEKFKAKLAQMQAGIQTALNRAADKASMESKNTADSAGAALPAVDTSLYEQVNQL